MIEQFRMLCWILHRRFSTIVGEELEAYDKIENGATVFVIFKTSKSLKYLADEVAYKDVKRQV